MKEKFYITTPIYYPSANFHIGHCYTTIIADAIARYNRFKGKDVFFLTGTDEHGQKIENKAKEANVSPKEYVDEIVSNAKDLWKSLNISYDKFIRTTDKEHEVIVQRIFDKLYEQGDIYLGSYEGLYCTPCESFWTESQLVDGKCPDCGRDVSLVKEESYFFRLSKYQDRLIKMFNDNPEFLQPVSRKNEMINNFIKPGLEDLCVSRTSFSWGIPVSFNLKHVIYVWIDALSNYITALGYMSDNDTLFKKYWPCDLHLVGKEIVRFHAIVWPALLMALDLPLPKRIFGHGWLKIGDAKISKSSNNYQDPRTYVSQYGVDAVRYYVLKEVSFGNDGNFSVEALVSRTNADLANTLGNLVNRTITMVHKYFDGKINYCTNYLDTDTKLLNSVYELVDVVDNKMEELRVSEAISSIFDVLRDCNKYIDENTPWVLAKEGKMERLEVVLYTLLESIRVCAILLQSFIPDTSSKIFEQLNVKDSKYENLKDKVGFSVNQPVVLFKRIEVK